MLQDQELVVVELELGAGVLLEEDLLADRDLDLFTRPVVERASRADGQDRPSCGRSLAVSGRTMPLFVISSRGVGLTMTLLPRGFSWVAVPLTVLVMCAWCLLACATRALSVPLRLSSWERQSWPMRPRGLALNRREC